MRNTLLSLTLICIHCLRWCLKYHFGSFTGTPLQYLAFQAHWLITVCYLYLLAKRYVSGTVNRSPSVDNVYAPFYYVWCHCLFLRVSCRSFLDFRLITIIKWFLILRGLLLELTFGAYHRLWALDTTITLFLFGLNIHDKVLTFLNIRFMFSIGSRYLLF